MRGRTCEICTVFRRSQHLYDLVYSFKDFAAEAQKLVALIEARRPEARSLLDVACGTGKHLAALRRRFPDAEGLDLDDGLLAVARERLPGLAFHQGDMTSFDLGRRFDVVTCLFSSIGYAMTEEGLRAAVAAMAAHLEPRGVLLVEPWLEPGDWRPGHLHLLTVDEPDVKIARGTVAGLEGTVSTMDFHYLVVTNDGVEHFTERHEAGLFTRRQMTEAFESAGLAVELDVEGLIGRGLYIATRPA
jgi:SAM-dependent methyltransferase